MLREQHLMRVFLPRREGPAVAGVTEYSLVVEAHRIPLGSAGALVNRENGCIRIVAEHLPKHSVHVIGNNVALHEPFRETAQLTLITTSNAIVPSHFSSHPQRLHTCAPHEYRYVIPRKIEPLAIFALFRESLVPITLNPVRIVRLDRMNDLHRPGKLQFDLI